MPTPYTVRRGDTLSKIARQHGFRSWREIYNHPANGAFRTMRPNPDRIFPGDVIQIPDRAAPPAPPPAPHTITDEKCCHLARMDKECPYNGAKSNWVCASGYSKQHWDCVDGSRTIGCGECVKSPSSSCWATDNSDTTNTFDCSIWWWY